MLWMILILFLFLFSKVILIVTILLISRYSLLFLSWLLILSLISWGKSWMQDRSLSLDWSLRMLILLSWRSALVEGFRIEILLIYSLLGLPWLLLSLLLKPLSLLVLLSIVILAVEVVWILIIIVVILILIILLWLHRTWRAFVRYLLSKALPLSSRNEWALSKPSRESFERDVHIVNDIKQMGNIILK